MIKMSASATVTKPARMSPDHLTQALCVLHARVASQLANKKKIPITARTITVPSIFPP
jgi:hypothetical protein